MSINNSANKIFEYVLRLYFHAEVSSDMQELKQYLTDIKFPTRNKEFKDELARAISSHAVSVQKFERLTGIDYETQEEVDEFLETEIWKPLYGDEPITLQQAA